MESNVDTGKFMVSKEYATQRPQIAKFRSN